MALAQEMAVRDDLAEAATFMIPRCEIVALFWQFGHISIVYKDIHIYIYSNYIYIYYIYIGR